MPPFPFFRALVLLALTLPMAALAVAPGATSEAKSYTLAEACELLAIHRDTGYRMLRRGTFPVPARRVGGQWRIPRGPLDTFLIECAEDPEP